MDFGDLQLKHQLDVNSPNGGVFATLAIPTPDGRNNFGPGLSLNYSSSSRNSALGIGWSLSGISYISIGTKKGLPRYDGTDSYAFNGGISLVPALVKVGSDWQQQIVESPQYWIYHYRAKIEGSFIRFEKWVRKDNSSVYWRTVTGDNIISVYGIRDGIICDPNKKENIFSWLLEEQYDNQGNAIFYKYKNENNNRVDKHKPSEHHRAKAITENSFSQKYPDRILFGNSKPLLVDEPAPTSNRWLFEVVFDYGEYDPRPYGSNVPLPASQWPVRQDPFSLYNAGFEIRTYRLCRRILSYHNIAELSSEPSLTGIFEIDYNESPLGSTINKVSFTGVRRDLIDGTYSEKSLPSLSFTYTQTKPETSFQAGVEESNVNVPEGLNGRSTRLIDLFGEGLPGILTETANNWYYKANRGDGIFEKQEIVISKPSQLNGIYSLGDFDQDGNINLFSLSGRTAGYYEYDRHKETWSGFNSFKNIPQVTNAKFIDVNADGFADLVVETPEKLTCYPYEGKDGFGKPFEFSKPVSNGKQYAPTLGDDFPLDYFMADMSGDGLPDQVRIRNGRVEYYPNLGNGHFGEAVLMENAPVIEYESGLDASRVRLYDLDGSGTADIIYIGRGEIRYWYNASGNSFVEGGRISGLPFIDMLSTAVIADLLGDGTASLVWSNSLSYASGSPLQYLKLTGGEKPRLMTRLDNGLGAITEIKYGYSGSHYLASMRNGTPWISKTPSHFAVANQKIVTDTITNSQIATTYKYYDGHYDGNERSFVCFGLVEQFDVETFENGSLTHGRDYTQSSCTRTWLHPGLFGWDSKNASQYYRKDSDQPFLRPPFFESTDAVAADDFLLGYRSLAGKLVRQEIFAVTPEGQVEEDPFSITQKSYAIREIQPTTEKQQGAFYSYETESLEVAYDQISNDPKIAHHLSLSVDEVGNITRNVSVAYARRDTIPAVHPLQRKDYITLGLHSFLNVNTASRYRCGVLFESKEFEVNLIARNAGEIFDWAAVKGTFESWTSAAVSFDETLPATGNTVARLVDWNRSIFWNDTQTDALPLGQTGTVVLTHHEEVACFNNGLISQAYNGKVTNAMLSDDDEGDYIQQDGYWWQRSEVNHFNGLAGFYSLDKVEKQPGIFTTYDYDDYFLSVLEITDPLGNKTKSATDYNLVDPYRLTDPNDNVSEVLHDALGVPLVTIYQGTVLHNGSSELYGSNTIDSYVMHGDENFDNIIANPELYLQNASTFFFYDLNSSPLRSIRLVRENLLHDGSGNIDSNAVIQISLDYQDGFGRTIQNKLRVEAGLAIEREADGSVNTDAAGEPVLIATSNRWLVSGHVVYNNKQLPVRQFESFFSGIHEFENDSVLENYGVAVHQYYDAIGRMYRTDFPDSTFSEIRFTPWEITHLDQNDTLDRSVFKVLREIQPVGSPERLALDKALAHKDTPTIIQFDPMGREIVRVESNNNGTVKKIETVFDIHGNVLEINDARNLKAFEYKRDMLGRVLYEKSMDAGERWNFQNCQDQIIHAWDGRGVHRRTRYDALDRATTVHVDGALALNQITERFVYGEDASISQARERNLRGTLVIHYDQAGIQELKLAAPGNLPLHTERRLLDQFTSEPDWTNPPGVGLAPDVFASIYRYDGLGRPIEHQLPDQTTRKYIFNQGGGLQKILLSSSDGVLNHEEVLKNASYNAKGMRQNVVLGNDVEVSYTYDKETFRMKRLRSRKTSGTARTYQDIHYTYDPMGNLVHLVDDAQQPTAVNPHVLVGLNVSAHSEFTYDALYQLTSASGRVHQALLQNDYADRSREAGVPANWGKGTRHITLNNGSAIERYTRTYDYDEAGNIKFIRHAGISQNWTKQFWTSATSNRSLPLHDLNGIAIPDPENHFDVNGNCTQFPHLRSLEWNYRNNIAKAVVIDRSAQGKANDEEYYLYSGDGMRVRKITQRVVDVASNTVELTEKIYLDGCEIKRITRGGIENLKRFTSTISDGDSVIARVHSWEKDTHGHETDDVTKKKINYQLVNHLGSASLELDEGGSIITYEEYFPYGGTSFIAGKNKREIDLKEYRYCGKERDDFTGLYYFGYRFYAHWMGGWINPDPIGPQDSENLYLYVQNNPVNVVDPNGLESSQVHMRMLVSPAGLPEELRTASSSSGYVFFVEGMPANAADGTRYNYSFEEVLQYARANGREIQVYDRESANRFITFWNDSSDVNYNEYRSLMYDIEAALETDYSGIDFLIDWHQPPSDILSQEVDVERSTDGVSTGDGNGGTNGTGTGTGSTPGSGTSTRAGAGAGAGTSTGTSRGNGGSGNRQSSSGATTNGTGRQGGQAGGSPNGVQGGQVGGVDGGVLGGQLGGDPNGTVGGTLNGTPTGVPNGTSEGEGTGSGGQGQGQEQSQGQSTDGQPGGGGNGGSGTSPQGGPGGNQERGNGTGRNGAGGVNPNGSDEEPSWWQRALLAMAGALYSVANIFVEAGKQLYDMVGLGISCFGIATGWYEYEHEVASGIGMAAQQGQGTGDIFMNMGRGIIETPGRAWAAAERGDWFGFGAESMNLYMIGRSAYGVARAVPSMARNIGNLGRAGYTGISNFFRGGRNPAFAGQRGFSAFMRSHGGMGASQGRGFFSFSRGFGVRNSPLRYGMWRASIAGRNLVQNASRYARLLNPGRLMSSYGKGVLGREIARIKSFFRRETLIGRELGANVNGINIRADLAIMDQYGFIKIIEAKLGPHSSFTPNQTAAWTGGSVVLRVEAFFGSKVKAP